MCNVIYSISDVLYYTFNMLFIIGCLIFKIKNSLKYTSYSIGFIIFAKHKKMPYV